MDFYSSFKTFALIPICRITYRINDGDIKVIFDEPQRAVTTGQAVVFYSGDIVVGGGTISKTNVE